jgi:hypothetical protein
VQLHQAPGNDQDKLPPTPTRRFEGDHELRQRRLERG